MLHENWLSDVAESVRAEGVIYAPIGEGRVPFIDARDIAAVAAEVLLHPEAHAGKSTFSRAVRRSGTVMSLPPFSEATGRSRIVRLHGGRRAPVRWAGGCSRDHRRDAGDAAYQKDGGPPRSSAQRAAPARSAAAHDWGLRARLRRIVSVPLVDRAPIIHPIPYQREARTCCRNIKTLANFQPPATDDEIRASALQFVRKLSGATNPSHANEAVFSRARGGSDRSGAPPGSTAYKRTRRPRSTTERRQGSRAGRSNGSVRVL